MASNFTDIGQLMFWCQKILPLVYDDSLSYYEVLCKIVKYINDIIGNEKELSDEFIELKKEVEKVQEMLDNFDTVVIEKIVREYLATMIFVEISDAGYFIYYIPDSWENIQFETSGLDVELPDVEYGRLILSY